MLSKSEISENFEYVVCSAIWYKELELFNEQVLRIRGNSPYNVDRGIVFCGLRHPTCQYQMVAITGKRSIKSEVGEYIQGFLTNKNRFLTREEAEILVKSNGQLKTEIIGGVLTSEDLW